MGKVGNLGRLGKLRIAKKVKNFPKKWQNYPVLAHSMDYLQGPSEDFAQKVVQMCSFAHQSTSRDPFGRTFLVRLMAKNTALC